MQLTLFGPNPDIALAQAKCAALMPRMDRRRIKLADAEAYIVACARLCAAKREAGVALSDLDALFEPVFRAAADEILSREAPRS
jgi:hypothetical protein